MKRKVTQLPKKDILKLKKLLPLWSLNKKETEITRTYAASTHIDALVLIARITVHAQVLNHHPEILFTYAKLKIVLTTHDVQGLTKLDVDLAKQIDVVLARG